MVRSRARWSHLAAASVLLATPVSSALADEPAPASAPAPVAPVVVAPAIPSASAPSGPAASTPPLPAPTATPAPAPANASESTAAAATAASPTADNGRFEFGSYGRIGIRQRPPRRHGETGERRLVRNAYRRGQLRRARAPSGRHLPRRHPHEGRRDARPLPALLPLLRPGGDRHRRPQPVRPGDVRPVDALDRLADVSRRRHLPARLVAARQPEHGRRRRRREAPQRHDDRRARRDAAPRQPLPVRADPSRRAVRRRGHERHAARPAEDDRDAQNHPVPSKQRPPAPLRLEHRRLQGHPLRRGARARGRRVPRPDDAAPAALSGRYGVPRWRRARVLDWAARHVRPALRPPRGGPRGVRPPRLADDVRQRQDHRRLHRHARRARRELGERDGGRPLRRLRPLLPGRRSVRHVNG